METGKREAKLIAKQVDDGGNEVVFVSSAEEPVEIHGAGNDDPMSKLPKLEANALYGFLDDLLAPTSYEALATDLDTLQEVNTSDLDIRLFIRLIGAWN